MLGYLAEVLGSLGGLVPGGGTVTDAVRIDRIAMLEQIKGAVAAVQAAETVKFAQSQVAAQHAAGVDYRKLGRGIADQIALAVKVGPYEGSRRLTLARALWFDLPHTYDLLARGQISEYVAHLVATETNHLDPELRQQVDQQLAAAGLHTLAPKQAAATARKLAYAADPEGSLRRGRTARTQRRVSLRPAPDTMAILNAFLPVEQGVACYASLKAHTDARKADGDTRSRDQIMADTLVERLTGQTAADDVNAEVQITMPSGRCSTPTPAPANMPGYGPIPAWLAQEIMLGGQGRRWWRRLFTAPTSTGGTTVVGGDPTRRRFDGWLGKLIKLRDQYCREPYCTAHIRHIDHIRRYTEGGPTTFTNGRGVCERHNHTREMPGWHLTPIDDDNPVTTPSSPPPPPDTTTSADPPPRHSPVAMRRRFHSGGVRSAAPRQWVRRRVRRQA